VKVLCKALLFVAISGSLCACDDGTNVSASVEEVCGESGGGFVALQTMGGQIALGDRVLAELGARYVVVDPSCRFVVYNSREARGGAVSGWLSDEQAQELASFLSLHEWSGLDSEYGWSVCDGAVNRFVWGGRSVDLIPFCPESPIPGPPPSFRHDLQGLAAQLVSSLGPLGEPVAGPVRYLLFRGNHSTNADSQYVGAPAWPLDTPPDSVAITREEAMSEEASVQTASGEDAELLRSLRAAFLNGEFGVSYGAYVPIEQPDGQRFDLYVRDVVEFETPDGDPFLPWFAL